jgi:LysM repeat protein
VGYRISTLMGLLLLLMVLFAIGVLVRPVGAQIQIDECGQTYAARTGDSLATIAERCGVTLTALHAANPHIDPNNILPGQVLNIPIPPTAPQLVLEPAPALILQTSPQQILLQITPERGPPGTFISVAGFGFQPGQILHVGPAEVYQQPVLLYEVTTSVDGSFQLTLPLPDQAQPNQSWTILARDPQTGASVISGVFFVTQPFNPDLTLPEPVLHDPIYSPIPTTGLPQDLPVHIVQPGETLFRIGQFYGTTVSAILQVNPQIVNPNRIFTGQAIRIPVMVPIPPTGPGIPPTGADMYIVLPGDTLAGIAGRFGTTVQTLVQINPQIVNPNILEAGRAIRIR